LWLVVGLGNPGREYEATRHNVGFMVADELARRWNISSWRSNFGGEIVQTDQIVLLKPQEFMNVSGQAVQRTQTFYRIALSQTIVIHDEIDLQFGRLRIKVAGGHGGHNGLRSIMQMVGDGFVRVRCGVGKPARAERPDFNDRVLGHVLGGFNQSEKKELPFLIGGAADVVERIIDKGPVAAMNQFNTEDKPRS
jgi:PTH1 family peptidyl-tRNA hydrolase